MPEPGRPDGTALAQLEAAAGPDSVVANAALRIDGAALPLCIRPVDGAALARTVVCLGQQALPVVISGGGTRLDCGNPPRGARALLSLQRIAGILELDAGDGVLRAAAGTPLSELRRAAHEAGWELPLDAPGAASTLGGALASAAIGPRALGYGLPRDQVLGLDVVLASGERTRCGGRVVKNVTGFDLNKLYVGSLGRLGVIEAAWLRLRPRAAEVRWECAEFDDLGAALASGSEASRRAAARAVVVAANAAAPARLVVEWAGDAARVARDVAWARSAWGSRECGVAALDALRREEIATGPESSLRLRIGCLPTRLPALCARIAASARLRIQPGLQLLHAEFEPADETEARRCLEAAIAAVREVEGEWRIERAPLATKQGLDVFGVDAGSLALMRALTERFDPEGLFNPGRGPGRL